MTNKDKQILLAEIERLKKEELSKKDNCGREGMKRIVHKLGAYNRVISFINSLPEEPISRIWYDASEKSNNPEDVVIINPEDNTGEVLTNCTFVYQGRIWAYTSELLKFDNSFQYLKNWKELESEGTKI